MAAVAKLLGVEISEEFRIKGQLGVFYLTTSGMFRAGRLTSTTLKRLLAGEIEIERPWRPANNEVYFIPRPDDKVLYEAFYWHSGSVDCKYYKQGMVFQHHDLAIEAANKMLAVLQE